MELPPNFRVLDEGTQDYIRDLLRQLNEARRDLDRAQTDQVVVCGQLTNADTKAASKISGHVFLQQFLLHIFRSNPFFPRLGVAGPESSGRRPSRHRLGE